MITYHETTRIWLHLQPFTERGLTIDRALQIVGSMDDPGKWPGAGKLQVERAGGMGIIVDTNLLPPDGRRALVDLIDSAFQVELEVIGSATKVNHQFLVQGTGQDLYRVECVICKVVVHPASTSVNEEMRYHEKHPDDNYPGEEMKTEYDFSDAEKAKFYRPWARIKL